MNQLNEIGRGIKVGIVNITPEQASKMLERNTNNRPLRKGRISQYALDMEEGYWQLNGVPIIFDGDGTLLDGQNRLNAIIRSGIACEILIITGVSKSSFQTIDTGSNRTGRDILSIYGIETEKAGYLTGLIQRLNRESISQIGTAWAKSGGATMQSRDFSKKREKLTNTLILNYYKENYESLDRVYDFCIKYKTKIVKVLRFPLYLLAFHNLSKINIIAAEEFFEKLATGENLSGDSPIYQLREKLIIVKNSETEKLPGWHYPALIYKAWNAYRKGNQIKKLYISISETEPQKPI